MYRLYISLPAHQINPKTTIYFIKNDICEPNITSKHIGSRIPILEKAAHTPIYPAKNSNIYL